jgi:hypothetical protein
LRTWVFPKRFFVRIRCRELGEIIGIVNGGDDLRFGRDGFEYAAKAALTGSSHKTVWPSVKNGALGKRERNC